MIVKPLRSRERLPYRFRRGLLTMGNLADLHERTFDDAFRHDQTGRRPSPPPQPASRHRRGGRRLRQAVHRRLQQLHRHRSRTRPPGQGRPVRQAVRPRGGRRAVRVQYDRHLRRGRDGPPGHEVLAAQPRVDRRFGRDDGRGPPLRRHDLHPQLRQDHPRHVDGGHAMQHPDDLRQRRADGGRQGTAGSARRSCSGSSRSVAPPAARAAACSRPTA